MALESAFGWIGDIAHYFGSWLPHPIKVLATHRGVKFVAGKTVKVLDPGFYWYVPAITEVYVYPVVEQTDDIPVQSGCTKDRVAVAIGGTICYRIDNIYRALVDCYEIAHVISDRSVATYNEFVSEHTFEEILEGNTGDEENFETGGGDSDETRYDISMAIDESSIDDLFSLDSGTDSARHRINAALTRRVRSCLRNYGVEVLRAQLTHFGPCQTFVHVGHSPQPVVVSSPKAE